MEIRQFMRRVAEASRGGRDDVPGNAWARVISVVALTVIGVAVYRYPLSGALLGAALSVYAAVLWFRPHAWLVLVPALLPILDLGPWSGWIFFNEFDLLVLATVAVGYARLGRSHRRQPLDRMTVMLAWLLALSYAVSLARGLLPLEPLDDNAFSSYLSHYNSLRVAKGFFWVVLLLPLLRRAAADRSFDFRRRFLRGTLIGVAALVVVVLWERFLFPGLFNFSNQYRVSGLFSGMQTGGPQVETYVSLTIAFVAVWFLLKPGTRRLPVALALYAGATYVMLVTFSRAGYLALVIITVLVAVGAVSAAPTAGRWRWVFLAALGMALVGVATPIVKGSFTEARLARAGGDLEIRLAHWRSAMYMRDRDVVTRVFGMGLGTFPATYYVRNEKGVFPGNFRFEREAGNGFLRLGGGDSLYVGQRVSTTPDTRYRLELDLRNAAAKDSQLIVFICEKQLIYSYRCVRLPMPVNARGKDWEHREITLNIGPVGAGRWYARRPVEFSLSNPVAGSLIDVDNVRLLAPAGANLLANGDFSAGSHRWFFTTDNGWPWRIENVWLQILFEQGWYGVIVFSVLAWTLCYRLARRYVRGDLFAAGLLASILGPLAIGVFSSSFVSARLALLFYLLLFIADLHLRRAARGGDVPGRGTTVHSATDDTKAKAAGDGIHAVNVDQRVPVAVDTCAR
jgi:hypothetical protein